MTPKDRSLRHWLDLDEPRMKNGQCRSKNARWIDEHTSDQTPAHASLPFWQVRACFAAREVECVPRCQARLFTASIALI
jgi:hypothetical protein